ncbi:MMPL family transporter [Streptomyces sp. NPDC001118]
MLQRLGAFLSRKARTVLVLAGLLTLAAGAAGFGVFGQLKGGGFEDPAAPSTAAARLLHQTGGTADLALLVRPRHGTVDSPGALAAGRALTDRLAARDGVEGVDSYWRTPVRELKAEDGRAALVLVRLDGDREQVTQRADALIADYASGRDGATPTAAGTVDPIGRELTVLAGGPSGTNRDITTQVAKDLGLAEGIAVPVTLALLVLVFRGLVPALIPLAIGAAAILGTFAELRLLAGLTDVSVFAVNLTTALGLGLAIDYGLLMVSRFREQTAAGQGVPEAVGRTVATAGRTILFSAATVAAALTAPLIFPLYFLRSFAYAGIGVVVTAALCALVVTPALLTVLGHRVARPGKASRSRPAAPGRGSAVWGAIARTVFRHPLRTGLPAVAVLVLAATPLLGARFGVPDERVLPEDAASRSVATALHRDFPGGGGGPIEIVVSGAGTQDARIDGYARTLAALPGVDAVQTDAGTFTAGAASPTSPGDPRRAASGLRHLTVRTGYDASSEAARRLVGQIRAVALPGPGKALVGGPAAQAVDTRRAIQERLPVALAMIVGSTFVLLFLFTGSVLQPVRALLLNALGLGAVLGTMVWIFQAGNFSSVLGFTPMPMDTAMTLLMFCIVFGLSMDYEVFVLSRIKELHDRGLSPAEAVPRGLARSGALVSAAAALLAVSLFAFTTSHVSFMQMFGLGSGLAVLVDATLIRGVLVPACLRLMGRYGWYAPGPLRRVHRRIGLTEGVDVAEERRTAEVAAR